MKKIGIVTFHNADNYGAFLQCYGLTQYLERHGFEPEVINYRDPIIKREYSIIRTENPKLIVKTCLFLPQRFLRHQHFEQARKRYLPLSTSTHSVAEFTQACPNYNVIITGSDQVWNQKLTASPDVYFLKTAPEQLTKISYAASIGDLDLFDKCGATHLSAINNLDAISVRETSAQTYLQKHIAHKVHVALDPTLLHDPKFWEQQLPSSREKQKPYILAYQLDRDPQLVKDANLLQKQLNLPIYYGDHRNIGYHKPSRSFYTQDPLTFLRLVHDAKVIITTSFHATIFSIIFHKPFYVIPHKETGSRVIDLLAQLDLSDRIISEDNLSKINSENPIDWGKIDQKLAIMRKKSQKWLLDAIKSPKPKGSHS